MYSFLQHKLTEPLLCAILSTGFYSEQDNSYTLCLKVEGCLKNEISIECDKGYSFIPPLVI